MTFKTPRKAKNTTRKGGGLRKKVREFSRPSRTRLLRLLASINLDAVLGSAVSVTLTYPYSWPEDPRAWKDHLDSWRKRMERKYGRFACVWRLGFQQRGAPHFHFILFMEPSLAASRASLKQLRGFVGASWYEICGKLCEEHLLAGTQVQRIRSARDFKRTTRYIAKPESLKEDAPSPGRFWGVWNRKLLPIEWETERISFRDGLRVRRTYKRLAGFRGSGSLAKTQVFVRHKNTTRLLEHLGYGRRSFSTDEAA